MLISFRISIRDSLQVLMLITVSWLLQSCLELEKWNILDQMLDSSTLPGVTAISTKQTTPSPWRRKGFNPTNISWAYSFLCKASLNLGLMYVLAFPHGTRSLAIWKDPMFAGLLWEHLSMSSKGCPTSGRTRVFCKPASGKTSLSCISTALQLPSM